MYADNLHINTDINKIRLDLITLPGFSIDHYNSKPIPLGLQRSSWAERRVPMDQRHLAEI